MILCGTLGCGDEEPNRDPGDGAGAGSSSSTAEGLCVNTINDYRASVGVPALARWYSAEPCVDDQAYSDSQSGQAHGAFGQCGEWAQNECPGWPSPPEGMIEDCLAMMWAEGPGGGHYENMKNEDSTMVACGFYDTGNQGVWAVQDFR